jgi:hypothetical protein
VCLGAADGGKRCGAMLMLNFFYNFIFLVFGSLVYVCWLCQMCCEPKWISEWLVALFNEAGGNPFYQKKKFLQLIFGLPNHLNFNVEQVS